MIRRALLGVPLALVACTGPGTPAPPTPPAQTVAPPLPEEPPRSLLPTGITAFAPDGSSTQVWDDFDAVAHETEFLGLGETVHTSGGYHRARATLIRHMITDLGFRAVALETPWATARVTRDYVRTCQGTPEAALRGIFSVFASVEMRNLLVWMCKHNQDHPKDPVSFWGFDVQDPWALGASFRRFMAEADPASPTIAKNLEACTGVAFDTSLEAFADPQAGPILMGTTLMTDGELAACKEALTDARAWLDARQGSLRQRPGPAALARARLALDGIDANIRQLYWFFRPGGLKQGFEARDAGMASALLAMRDLESPNQKVAIIAHNTHLAHAQSEIQGYYQGVRAMGQMLREDHRASYAAVAVAARTVHIKWGSFEDPPVADDPADVEQKLFGLGEPALFVDLARATHFDPGAPHGLGGETLVPAAQFRALVYLQASEPMRYAPCVVPNDKTCGL